MAQTTDPRAVGKVREALLTRWNTMTFEQQELDGIRVADFLRERYETRKPKFRSYCKPADCSVDDKSGPFN